MRADLQQLEETGTQVLAACTLFVFRSCSRAMPSSSCLSCLDIIIAAFWCHVRLSSLQTLRSGRLARISASHADSKGD